MKTLNLTSLWSVLALSLIIVRAVDTYQSAARPGNESNSNTAKLLRTGRRPASSRRFTSLSAREPPAVRQVKQRSNIQPGSSNGPDVSVTCSASDFVLRVKPTFYGLFADKEELKLGDNCESNGVLRPYGDLLFTYPLTACGAVLQSASHHVVYKFVLHYEPSVRSWPKVDVDIECHYPRNYHVSKLIVQPTWKTAVMHKRLKGLSKNFHIELMDGKTSWFSTVKKLIMLGIFMTSSSSSSPSPYVIDSWSKPARTRVYQLGSQINFQVSAFYLPHGAKVYISSCFVVPASGSGSSQKYIVIDNSGCLLDSKRVPGMSQFISQTNNTLRFSLRAFQFVAEPEIALKFQCHLLVTFEGPGPVHKSCTYRGNRWEALSGDDSICECCDSQCVTSKRRRALMKGPATSRLLMVSDQPSMNKEGLSSNISTSSSISRDGGSATSHYINDLQSHDNQGGTDLVLYGKYDQDQDDGYDSRSNLDLDKQSDMGELLVENNKFTVTTAVLFKGTGSRYSLDEDVSKGDGEEFEGENDDISQPEQVQKLNWKKIEEILPTDISQLRKQRDSEEVEEIREHEEEEGNGRMLNSEEKLRNGKELDGDGLMTWYFW